MNSLYTNFYQVCRLCLSKLNGSSIKIFNDNENNNYRVKIKSCFSISIEESDNLPSALCPTCIIDVDKFYKFKEKVIRNNAFLKAYAFNRIHKNGEHNLKSACNKSDIVDKEKMEACHTLEVTAGEEDPISRFLSNNGDKIKIELIPQIHSENFNCSQTVLYVNNENIGNNINNDHGYHHRNDVIISAKMQPVEVDIPYCNDQQNVSLKEEEVNNDYSDIRVHAKDISQSHFTNGVIIHSDDYDINGSLNENVQANVCIEENYVEYDSEDTKSATTDIYKEEIEDDDKLIIDEGCDIREVFPDNQCNDVSPSDKSIDKLSHGSCILLRTLTSSTQSSHMNGVYYPDRIACRNDSVQRNLSQQNDDTSLVLPSLMQIYESSPAHQQLMNTVNCNEKSSTRRKQKCPTKASDVIEDSDEMENITREIKRSPVQEIIHISPVTVTCSTEGEETTYGYSQVQFLDEVLSRHSSPATTPPIIPQLHAERLHKACDVLLRAASKIDLPSGMDDSLLSNSNSDHSSTGSNLVKKSKTKDKLQNIPQQPQKECSNCHAIQTTIWRRDRFGNIVCNACGLYYKLHNFDRPGKMRRDEIHKRNRKRSSSEIGKKNKRSVNMDLNDSYGEQENVSALYSNPNYGRSMNMAGVYLSNGVPKKRHRSSNKKPATNNEDGYSFQSDIQSVQSDSCDKTSSLNNLYNHENLRMMAAFQLSTRFLPINPTAAAAYNGNEENSLTEAPLNLAASSH